MEHGAVSKKTGKRLLDNKKAQIFLSKSLCFFYSIYEWYITPFSNIPYYV